MPQLAGLHILLSSGAPKFLRTLEKPPPRNHAPLQWRGFPPPKKPPPSSKAHTTATRRVRPRVASSQSRTSVWPSARCAAPPPSWTSGAARTCRHRVSSARGVGGQNETEPQRPPAGFRRLLHLTLEHPQAFYVDFSIFTQGSVLELPYS